MRDLISDSLFHFVMGLACLITGSSSLAAHNHAEHQVIRSVQNGLWSSPETWESGKVPGAGAQVLVQRDHQIVYDLDSKEVIRGIQISGKLTFASDRNTRLEVGLIRIEQLDHYCEDGFDCQMVVESDAENTVEKISAAKRLPTLEVGQPDSPLPAKYTALIRLHYIEGMNKETCPWRTARTYLGQAALSNRESRRSADRYALSSARLESRRPHHSLGNHQAVWLHRHPPSKKRGRQQRF